MTKPVSPITKTRSAVVLSLLLAVGGCVSLPSGKKAFIAVPVSQEKAMGEQAYQEVLTKEKISHDPRLNAILQRVGQRIAAVTPVEGFDWQFTLIESPEMNAFCLPGGKVAVYTGILPLMQNEAAMAIVIGHEVAHAVMRHGSQRMTQALGLEIVGQGLGVLMGDNKYKGIVLGAYGLGAQGGVLLPFSRANETEADTFGIRYAAAAGYDPAEGPRFWQRFAEKGGGKPPAWMSTHPSDESRIQNLERLQAEAQGLYANTPRYGLGEKL
jgi:predicted Zn-dependent protease